MPSDIRTSTYFLPFTLPSYLIAALAQVVLAFFEPQLKDAPLRELFSFDRVHLRVGETKEVLLFMSASAMGVTNELGTSIHVHARVYW